MLKLKSKFDLQRDVVSDVSRTETSAGKADYWAGEDTCILNIERDGGVIYSWRGGTGTTRIGKYDPNTKQNKLLYTFDKQVCVSSCSLNKEETLLAVSLTQRTRGEEHLKPTSKCLTLLIEIHPINNTKVLKAVDCRVRVQFLHPDLDRSSVLESHLLLLAEDGYVDQYHVFLSRQEGYRVVMVNPERLSKLAERVAEDFSWVQWDAHTQRLYYLTHKDKPLLRCVQFFPSHNCETVLELPLEIPSNSFKAVRFVNLGFDHYNEETPEQELVRMEVFTNTIERSMCVCYSRPLRDNQDLTYTVVFVHKGCSKTFGVSLDSERSPQTSRHLHPLFIPVGYYILVYLSGYFLHCINTRQQEMLCHSLFLFGQDADLGLPDHSASITVLGADEESACALLDTGSGRIYSADLSATYLMQILCSDTPTDRPRPNPHLLPPFGPSNNIQTGCILHPTHRRSSGRSDLQRLAALHCLLVYMGNDPDLELQIIDWFCDNMMAFETFDQIQEFILASLYNISYEKSLCLDKVLPYSSVFDKKVPVGLLEVPGVSCITELHTDPVFRGKAKSLQGFWSELQWITERIKYLEAVPNLRYRASHAQVDWGIRMCVCRSERRLSSHLKRMEENTKKVLSMVDTWSLDKKLVPLFNEEDSQQMALIGLMVDKLREHLNRHLPRLGKKKIESLVVNYVAKLLELIRHMLESVWLKYKLGPRVLCLTQQGSSAEWAVFHFMCRILEATRGLCLPLPPGYHTLLAVLGVRCLPHQTFLQYIDHGLLQLTETFITRLMTDLDNSVANEKLKFSILKRLSKPMGQRIYQLWDHPVTSASISRDYVRTLLEKHSRNKGSAFTGRDKPGSFRSEFLPLTYLAKILSNVEEQALNPFEEQENVDAKFVEETALKQTLILLGCDNK
ncbi:gamma-secretase-activating protein [Lampris incognitus]|uniref:gamma-secretase-activating protein n=1 Tax=Lampris incognitus TaxID=2546036 RepID=UPI0024B49DCF|nr:gamma-secretase-activating protein [Lampris incognitus]